MVWFSSVHQERIETLERLLEIKRDCYDSLWNSYLALDREVRLLNKSCRNKKKLRKALHEANNKIKSLETALVLKNPLKALDTLGDWKRVDEYVGFIDPSPPNCT